MKVRLVKEQHIETHPMSKPSERLSMKVCHVKEKA